MEMHQIRYFLALCEELNFTRAARRCGISQPSLTNAIKSLERELNGPLFRRWPMTLTNRAATVRPHLAKAVASIERARRAARRSLARGRDRKAAAPISKSACRAYPSALT